MVGPMMILGSFPLKYVCLLIIWLRNEAKFLSGEAIIGKMVSKKTWSVASKNKKALTPYYQITVKYPHEGKSLKSWECKRHVLKTFMLFGCERYNFIDSSTELHLLRMPPPYDARKAYLKPDPSIYCGVKPIFNDVFCCTLIHLCGAAAFVAGGGMLVGSAFLVNFAVPYCYANLAAWPFLVWFFSKTLIKGTWWWAQEVEGEILRNDGEPEPEPELEWSVAGAGAGAGAGAVVVDVRAMREMGKATGGKAKKSSHIYRSRVPQV